MAVEHTKLHHYLVSVGSNIEPRKHLAECETILAAETQLLGIADYIDTEPDGFKDQPWFVNGAYYIASPLAHDDFKAYLKAVEERLGRVKGPIKSGPRTMDLDIITVDGHVVHNDYYHKSYVTIPVDQLIGQFALTLNAAG
ncbi:2-amino-4-hydroxy-6-hydroxymethyldihydropteridine diphosphokinase [Pseudomaricurvus sp. HS19]|uniref:2-amino-4-hydroxy-6- hydroxymethyldihydropteridine diphosphokinase n=1 Tax=Pseudomaricurvus sp. HS19 TaxID=2692626 RepID=UPI00136A589B|nr:2-amino-4-hydroxy-6-hydroxymethyldihydropteridine diphosphokinase [Pseudomaricurvus sp. HS19]MYM62958.1 2-amino-4-hydroxy-6-hydroxymethyldihydropteridine diphosphokinase [Pseudomaricurvus sp. HS19]